MKPESLQFTSQDTSSDRSPSGPPIGVPKTPPGAPDTGGRAQRLSAGSSLKLPGGCVPRSGGEGAREGGAVEDFSSHRQELMQGTNHHPSADGVTFKVLGME